MSEVVVVEEEPKILFTSDQNKSCSECQQDVRNIFFGSSTSTTTSDMRTYRAAYGQPKTS